MAWQIKAFIIKQACRSEFEPQSLHGRQELTPRSCPMTLKCALWNTHTHKMADL